MEETQGEGRGDGGVWDMEERVTCGAVFGFRYRKGRGGPRECCFYTQTAEPRLTGFVRSSESPSQWLS